MELLVETGADVNAMDVNKWTPLHNACCRCGIKESSLWCVLMASKSSLFCAWHSATDVVLTTLAFPHRFSSSLETVDKLLAAGAKTDVRDKDGWTPLHFAARFNNVEMLDSLLAVSIQNQLNIQTLFLPFND